MKMYEQSKEIFFLKKSMNFDQRKQLHKYEYTHGVYFSGRFDYGNAGPLAEAPRLDYTSAAGSQPSTSTAGSQPSTSTAGSQPSTSTADSELPDIPPTTLNVDDFFVMRACSECKLVVRNNNPTTGDAAEGRRSGRFMVTCVCKIHHSRGQSRIVLAAKKNVQINGTLYCPQTKAVLNCLVRPKRLVRRGYLGCDTSPQLAK